MSKAEKESLLREGQKRFYLDGGGVTLVKSYVRQIEKYHCVYEESKVFQELEKVRAGNAYLLSHVCYNQTGKLEHLMSVALSVEAKTVKAAELFGIGQHRLRKSLSDDYECKYHLMVGRVIRIKRKPFEEYINRVG